MRRFAELRNVICEAVDFPRQFVFQGSRRGGVSFQAADLALACKVFHSRPEIVQRLEMPGGRQCTAAVTGHQVVVLVRFAAVEPDDGQQVLLLFGAEVADLARHLAVDGARVDHQHLVAVRLGLGAIQEPQLARHGAGVEEVGADGDHHVHVAAFHQLAPDLGLGAAGAGRLRGHHEAGPAARVQVAVEVTDPHVVAVAHLGLLVDAGQAEGQARVGPHLVGVDLVHVEGRVGHHVIGPGEQFVRVLVVGDGLPDVAFEAVHREVHAGEADGGGVLFQAAKGEALGGALAVRRHGAGALHEHAAGAARRVEHGAALRVQHVGDQRHQRDGREELTAVVRLLVGELGEEVFVDAPEDVALDPFQLVGVEGAQQLAEDVVVQFLVFALGQDAAQAVVV